MVGGQISHYRIVSQLGAGGMGVVYQAEDLRLGRSVALKFLPDAMMHERQALDRFEIEARAASALNHPNICTIHDIGTHEGRPFIVMELMKGQTLADRIAHGPLKVKDVVEMGIQLSDALDAAHHQGIIHRDIKPANIFVTDRGEPKILDFGLAKLGIQTRRGQSTDSPPDASSDTSPDQLTSPGLTLGTVAYMSPEQARGEELDARTDVFSLGVVLYEMVTGRPAFGGSATAVVFDSILNRPPVAPVRLNPEVTPRFEEILNRSLEKDRALRYQHASDLCADLKRLRRDSDSRMTAATMAAMSHPPAAGPSSGGWREPSTDLPPAAPPPSSGGTQSAAAGGTGVRYGLLAVLVVGLAAGWLLWSRSGEQSAPPPALPTPAATSTADTSGVADDLAQASQSLAMRDYATALAAAERVLAVDPGHRDARGIADEAELMIARFDEATADARRLLEAGDSRGAAEALAVAASVSPSDPVVAELSGQLSSQLADQVRRQAEAAEEAIRQARRAVAAAAEPPPTVSAPPPARPEPAPSEPAPPQPQVEPSTPPPAQPGPPPAETGRPAARAEPEPEPEPATPAPPATASPEPRPPVETAARPTAAERRAADERAIREVLSTYVRAIEEKDLDLFRSAKPNLSAAEESRLRDSFRAVQSQQVDLQVLQIDLSETEATVRLSRRDTIAADRLERTVESQQTMTLVKADGRWVITSIGA